MSPFMSTRVIALGVLLIGAVFMAAPFVLMLGTSLMTYAQTVTYPPEFWPSPVSFDNFKKALTETPLLRYLGNSLVVAGITVVGQVVTGSMAGFAFARLHFKGRNALFFAVLATMMVPVYINLVPMYVMMASIGWVDTYQALILPGLTGAFGIFLFRQWFLNLPSELEDAARIDGCSPWDMYWRIAMPTAWPAIATLAIFEFLASWNTFLWPLVVTNSDALRTLPVGLAAFKSSMREATDWGLLMAATTVAVVPALLVFLVGQRHFVRGMLEGAVKD
jgi:multiple sugar transport system permease protein